MCDNKTISQCFAYPYQRNVINDGVFVELFVRKNVAGLEYMSIAVVLYFVRTNGDCNVIHIHHPIIPENHAVARGKNVLVVDDGSPADVLRLVANGHLKPEC